MKKQHIEFIGGEVLLESGRLAPRADGAVMAKYGNTHVLCTVCFKKKVDAGAGFFPLSVHYQERFYAAGRVPGGFFKREGRPSEREIIISRIIDRSIRPLFPKGFLHEVQVVCTLVSYDADFCVEIPALLGASAALLQAGLPVEGAVAAVRVGMIDGELAHMTSPKDVEKSSMDVFVSGTKDGIIMVEASAQEHSESDMLKAILQAHEWMQPLVSGVEKDFGRAPSSAWEDFGPVQEGYMATVLKALGDKFDEAYALSDKKARDVRLSELRAQAKELLPEDAIPAVASSAIGAAEATGVRARVIKNGKRIDGRDLSTVRPLDMSTQVLPSAHGSAVFQRGATQVLATTTLCNVVDSQIIDTVDGGGKQRFMLHYNFPPFSVGEAGRMGATGRREIGHGRLAWKAVSPVLPSEEKFPYALRCVSEVLASDGSSSMATVCGVTLALMDAGVPVSAPVAGVAMGLIKEGKKTAVLTDILGDEDSLGDMDFKVAGTAEGVTALQMDLKIPFVDKSILKSALSDAYKARKQILQAMHKEMPKVRSEVHATAPAIRVIQVPRDAIGRVVGSGGRVIKGLTSEHDVQIDIAQDGTTTISGMGHAGVSAAVAAIEDILYEPKKGDEGPASVKKIFGEKILLDFKGCFGVLAGVDLDVSIGDTLNVRINKVDKANDKIYFVLADDKA